MNPKTLQYIMGHSDISVTLGIYTHVKSDDAQEDFNRVMNFRQDESEKTSSAMSCKVVNLKIYEEI